MKREREGAATCYARHQVVRAAATTGSSVCLRACVESNARLNGSRCGMMGFLCFFVAACSSG